MRKVRDTNADIIRCLALFCVLSVHFCLYSGMYSQIVAGAPMYVMLFARSIFSICVPLFIMLSGYLLKDRKLSVDYYKRGVKTLVIYVLASMVCILYKTFYLKEPMSAFFAAKVILNYTGAPYAWYIEMYIGLFFLIPFLNILYNNVETKRWKQVLIVTMIALTSLSGVMNVYDFSSSAWWGKPSMNGTFVQLVPAWWTRMYPLTYYFIGCYIKEYGVHIKKSVSALLVAGAACLIGGYNIWRCHDSYYIEGAWQEYGSALVVVLAVSVFVFIMNLDCNKLPEKLRTWIGKVSGLCLGGYLVSWVFDEHFYAKLADLIPNINERFKFYFLLVPVIYVCSIGTSYILECMYKGGKRVYCGLKVRVARN